MSSTLMPYSWNSARNALADALLVVLGDRLVSDVVEDLAVLDGACLVDERVAVFGGACQRSLPSCCFRGPRHSCDPGFDMVDWIETAMIRFAGARVPGPIRRLRVGAACQISEGRQRIHHCPSTRTSRRRHSSGPVSDAGCSRRRRGRLLRSVVLKKSDYDSGVPGQDFAVRQDPAEHGRRPHSFGDRGPSRKELRNSSFYGSRRYNPLTEAEQSRCRSAHIDTRQQGWPARGRRISVSSKAVSGDRSSARRCGPNSIDGLWPFFWRPGLPNRSGRRQRNRVVSRGVHGRLRRRA